jgi:hypothetical protein
MANGLAFAGSTLGVVMMVFCFGAFFVLSVLVLVSDVASVVSLLTSRS